MSSLAALPRDASRLLVSLLLVYVLLLTWLVLWKLDAPYIGAAAGMTRPIKLIPFVSRGDAGASGPLEVIANVVLFVPLGIYLGILFPRLRWFGVTLVAGGVSLVFEVTQYVISVGSFDTTDILGNAAGALVGLALLDSARRRFGAATTKVAVRIMTIATGAFLLATAAFLASPLRYAPPHDVIVHRPSPSS